MQDFQDAVDRVELCALEVLARAVPDEKRVLGERASEREANFARLQACAAAVLRELTARIWLRLERVRAKAALREREEAYRTLFESVDEGFLVADLLYDEAGKPCDFLYIEANPAAIRISGVPSYVGRRMFEIDPGFEKEWLEIGDRVVIVPEAATLLFQGGFPRSNDPHARRCAQSAIVEASCGCS